MNITAVITTFNRAEIVPEAIRSVLSQSKPVDELVVVNDGSSDHTEITVKAAFQEATIPCHYVYQINGGMAAALNRGINEANSHWVAFLDDDDLWDSNHIQRIYEINQARPDLGCIAGLRQEGGRLQTPPEKLLAEYQRDPEVCNLLIFKKRPLTRPLYTPVVGTAVVRKDLLKAVPFSPRAKARLDIQFFWRLSEITDIGLDQQSHGIGRQYRVSLLSTDADAPINIKQNIALKRSADEIAMLTDLIQDRDEISTKEFRVMLERALIGRSYTLRGQGRFNESIQHLHSCLRTCKSLPLIKEFVLSIFHVRPSLD